MMLKHKTPHSILNVDFVVSFVHSQSVGIIQYRVTGYVVGTCIHRVTQGTSGKYVWL